MRGDTTDRIAQSISTGEKPNGTFGKNQWGRMETIYDTTARLLKIDSQLLRGLGIPKNFRNDIATNILAGSL